jgi:uncharacterized damage-inducible protein DinB
VIFDFLVDTYETERLKTLGVWAQFRAGDLGYRPEPRARTPLEHMVHQCLSEEAWMTKMLGLPSDGPPLPREETHRGFLEHYAEASQRRLERLRLQVEDWFLGSTTFFDVPRSRAWVLVRRVAHTAHHRGQLTLYLRCLGRPLHSTYGPTADTGGLASNGARVIYPFRPGRDVVDQLVSDSPLEWLPGPGTLPLTERPEHDY